MAQVKETSYLNALKIVFKILKALTCPYNYEHVHTKAICKHVLLISYNVLLIRVDVTAQMKRRCFIYAGLQRSFHTRSYCIFNPDIYFFAPDANERHRLIELQELQS